LSATARAELSTFDIMQSPSLAALAMEVAEKSQYCRDSGDWEKKINGTS